MLHLEGTGSTAEDTKRITTGVERPAQGLCVNTPVTHRPGMFVREYIRIYEIRIDATHNY